VSDAYYPAGFVEIREVTDYFREYVIFSPDSIMPIREVDVGSHVRIEFDHCRLRRRQVNGSITVEGPLTKRNGTDLPIEASACSEVGHQARTATADLGVARALLISLGQLASLASEVPLRLEVLLDAISREAKDSVGQARLQLVPPIPSVSKSPSSLTLPDALGISTNMPEVVFAVAGGELRPVQRTPER